MRQRGFEPPTPWSVATKSHPPSYSNLYPCAEQKPYRVGPARLAAEARRGRMKEKPVSWYTLFYSAAAPLLSALA